MFSKRRNRWVFKERHLGKPVSASSDESALHQRWTAEMYMPVRPSVNSSKLQNQPNKNSLRCLTSVCTDHYCRLWARWVLRLSLQLRFFWPLERQDWFHSSEQIAFYLSNIGQTKRQLVWRCRSLREFLTRDCDPQCQMSKIGQWTKTQKMFFTPVPQKHHYKLLWQK